MNQKTRYTREDVESINARLIDAIRAENERLTITKVLTEITPTIRQMHEAGMSKTRIRETLKESGMMVPVRLIAAVLTDGVPVKRQYRPRKQAPSDPISLQADISNEPEEQL